MWHSSGEGAEAFAQGEVPFLAQNEAPLRSRIAITLGGGCLPIAPVGRDSIQPLDAPAGIAMSRHATKPDIAVGSRE